MRVFAALGLLFLLASLSMGSAGAGPRGSDVLLQSRIIHSPSGIHGRGFLGLSTTGHFIVQLDHLPSARERKLLAREGLRLLEYLPGKTWIAESSGGRFPQGVVYAAPLLPEDKISTGARGIGGNVSVLFFEGTPEQEARAIVVRYGAVLRKEGRRWIADIPAWQLENLAREDPVRLIEDAERPLVVANDGVRSMVGADAVHSLGLNGTGVTVAMWDAGYANHSDYNNRTVRGDPGEGSNHSHATHVAGTMVGDGGLSVAGGGTAFQWMGIAPNATLVTYEWPDLGITESEDETTQAVALYNASLSQNSWGYLVSGSGDCDSDMGDYDSWTASYDNLSRSLGILIVFSAGNERGSSTCSSSTRLYNTTTGPAATGKNVLTVGAVDKSAGMASFSSWGPTDDGRVKPDLVSVGVSVTSTYTGDTYSTLSGTSMASPGVSGAAALLIEAYRKEHADPLPSTVRGLLIHTAQDLYGTGPDYMAGYGLVNVSAAVAIVQRSANSSLFVIEGAVSGAAENASYAVHLYGNESELRLTLVWDDYPGTVGAAKDIINNLDLIVTAPDGTRYYPWTLDPLAPEQPAVRTTADALNTIEQVVVDSPAGGVWTILVNGTAVPEPNQTFSLVSSADLNSTIPIVTLASPANGSGISQPALFQCNATDVHGLANATLYTTINGWSANQTVNMTGISNSSSFSVSGIPVGRYAWNCLVANIVGHSAFAAANSTFTVSLAPNWSGNFSVTPLSYSADLSLFTINWSDDNVLDTVLFWGDWAGNATMDMLAPGYYGYNATLPGGAHRWQSFANDTDGNLNASDTFTFSIGRAPANVSLFLNGTAGNVSVLEDTAVNVTASLSPNSTLLLFINSTRSGNATGYVENVTVFTEPGAYNVTALFEGNTNYSGSSAMHVLSVNDTTPPNITAANVSQPRVIAGENVTFTAVAVDNGVLGSLWYVISNASFSYSGLLPGGAALFNSSGLLGSYTVTAFANDSFGNEANLTAGGLDITPAAAVNLSIVGNNGSVANATKITIRFNGTSLVADSGSNMNMLSASLPTGLFDIAVEAAFNMTLLGSTIANDTAANITMDSGFPVSSIPGGVLAFRSAVAAETGLVFTSATLVIPYEPSAFVSQSRIRPYVCHSWALASRTCSGSWEDALANASIDTAAAVVTINTTAFSAFAVGETMSCGDSVCDPGESCSSCAADCGSCPAASSGGGGSGIPTAALTRAACAEKWNCAPWGACRDEVQTRSCIDANSCGSTHDKPTETRVCPAAGLVNGKTSDHQYACDRGERICAGSNVAVCSDGRWVFKEACKFLCSGGACRNPAQPSGAFARHPPTGSLMAAAAGILLVLVFIMFLARRRNA